MMSRQDRIGSTATTVATVDGVTTVTYHSTAVVRFTLDHIVLDSGGWKTATTLRRMNQAAAQFDLGFRVHQDRGVWYIVQFNNHLPFRFVDGMFLQRTSGGLIHDANVSFFAAHNTDRRANLLADLRTISPVYRYGWLP